LLLPSAVRDKDGKPRFALPIPQPYLEDLAIKHLVERESAHGGFEYPTRSFFDAHLEPGDLLIDIGAHWGMFSLGAATRHADEIAVLAVEADPANVAQLLRAVAHNGLAKNIETIAAAAGDAPGTAPLIGNTTMGHSLYGKGLQGMQQVSRGLSVPVVTIDGLMAERPALAGRRVMMKIDVEGYEPQVIAGARDLLASGRVAALVWEHGRAFFTEPGRSAVRELMTELGGLGFSLHQLPSHELGGALIPFVPALNVCNVICLSGQFRPYRAYNRPPGPVARPGQAGRASNDPTERTRLTEALMAVGGSEGARWADPTEMIEGAERRAEVAGKHIPTGASVMDLGAGARRLGAALSASSSYLPVDLVRFATGGEVLDLNLGQFPERAVDVVAALDLVQYIHDVPALLARCRAAAPSLLLSYPLAEAGADSGPRRAQGWFNDFDEEKLTAMLNDAGWTVTAHEPAGDSKLFVCHRTSGFAP
jgi:FkbM family methyltransferase